MRRIVTSLFFAMGTLVAWGASTYDALGHVNTLGLTCITNSANYLPLAVAWGGIAVHADVAPTVDQLVVTSTLEVGDELLVYNRVEGRYDVFELTAVTNGPAVWTPRQVVNVRSGAASILTTANSAAETQMARGYGCWLHRPGAATRANQAVYLIGQVGVGSLEVTIAAGGETTFGQTLIGPPLPTDCALNNGPVDWAQAGAVAGDEIRLPQVDGSLQTVRFNGTQWTRSYYEKVNGINRLRRDTNPVIPAGQAAWYARKSGQPSFTITWGPQ